MGFSIGGFLGSLATTAISRLLSPDGRRRGRGSISRPPPPPQVFQPPAVSAVPQFLRQEAAFQPIVFRPPDFVGSQAGPTVTQAGGVLVPFVAGARGLLAALLGRASVNLGSRISSARVLSLVRDLGLAAAAAALGLTAIEVAQIIAAKPKRRRRGITASQLATTKATIRRVHSINDAIASVCPPARRRVHRHHPRHHRH